MTTNKIYPDLVVLLPGITGSELRNESGTVWGWSGKALLKNLLSAGESLRRDLFVANDPLNADVLDDGIRATRVLPDLHLIPGLWKIDGYGTIQELFSQGVEGYSFSRENFLPFPYDWRRDNRVSARLLRAKALAHLWAWRKSSGNQHAKLVLIAHSMGGLVSRYFLEVLEGWRETRALITFGTPYSGSVNAVDTLVNGSKSFGLDLTEACRSMASLHQLLPVYNCLEDGSGKLAPLTLDALKNVDAARATRARKFHEEIRAAQEKNNLDDEYRRSRYGIYPIVGQSQPTRNSVRLANGSIQLLETLGDDDPNGDGTVPRLSAVPEGFDLPGAMFTCAKHGKLQNLPQTLDHVSGILTSLHLSRVVFRDGKPRQIKVALAVDDAYQVKSEIAVRARPTRDTQLMLTISSRQQMQQVFQRPMRRAADGWHSEIFVPHDAGIYDVVVKGGDMVEQVGDVFEVVDRSAA